MNFLQGVSERDLDLTDVNTKELNDIVVNDLGIDISTTNSQGSNFLHRCFNFRPSHIIKLVEGGIDINARYSKGETVLHNVFGNILHARINDLEPGYSLYSIETSSSALLDSGADRSLEDGEGLTAVQLALRYRLQAESRLRSEPVIQDRFTRYLSTVIETPSNYATVPVNAKIVPAFYQKWVRTWLERVGRMCVMERSLKCCRSSKFSSQAGVFDFEEPAT